jgi:hypothetical protein
MHSRIVQLAVLAICMFALRLADAQTPETVGENLLRIEGTDAASGTRFVRLILLLRTGDAVPESVPRFTVECQERNRRRSMNWLIRFDGSPDFAFQKPFVATNDDLFPPQNPTAELKMRFEGYMRSQEFKRKWEVLPGGELRYRNPGAGSPNLDDPRHFTVWLNSLPDLRIGYVKPVAGQPGELVFQTKPLLELVKKAELCQP